MMVWRQSMRFSQLPVVKMGLPLKISNQHRIDLFLVVLVGFLLILLFVVQTPIDLFLATKGKAQKYFKCRTIQFTSIPITPFKTRAELGNILQAEKMKVGVELGVQRGLFAEHTLNRWTLAERYVLVDLWRSQQNYADVANRKDKDQETFKTETLNRMRQFEQRGVNIEVCQDLTTNCAKKFEDETFDFIYVDARHDYKGVAQDLNDWWPKLKRGGIMGGHDYVTNDDGPLQTRQNWSINYDGTVDPLGRAVKGAVDEFFKDLGLQISVSYRERGFNSWAVRKAGKHPYL